MLPLFISHLCFLHFLLHLLEQSLLNLCYYYFYLSCFRIRDLCIFQNLPSLFVQELQLSSSHLNLHQQLYQLEVQESVFPLFELTCWMTLIYSLPQPFWLNECEGGGEQNKSFCMEHKADTDSCLIVIIFFLSIFYFQESLSSFFGILSVAFQQDNSTEVHPLTPITSFFLITLDYCNMKEAFCKIYYFFHEEHSFIA